MRTAQAPRWTAGEKRKGRRGEARHAPGQPLSAFQPSVL